MHFQRTFTLRNKDFYMKRHRIFFTKGALSVKRAGVWNPKTPPS